MPEVAQQSVDVVAYDRGRECARRTLSVRGERRAVRAAALRCLGASLATMAGVVVLAWAAGFVLDAPVFAGAWAAATALATGVMVRRVRRRSTRYRVGPRMDADTFALRELELVRPLQDGVGAARGFELALVHGMQGVLDEGTVRTAIEGLTRPEETVALPLRSGVRARVEWDGVTFAVIPRAPEAPELAVRSGQAELTPRALAAAHAAGSARGSAGYLACAVLVGLMSAARAPVTLTDADLVSAIPRHLTPYQVEVRLRDQAQAQSSTLHACFDPMPLHCQRAGYVGVGLRLGADGAVRSSWVARSTYGDDCPVTACMESIIARWFFEPVHQPMVLVIPVQVWRTRRPLPEGVPVRLAAGVGRDAAAGVAVPEGQDAAVSAGRPPGLLW